MHHPPERYHRDMFRLTVQGASRLYAYWEVSNRKRWLCSQHLQCDWSEMCKSIRVYDVTWIHFDGQNANGLHDLGISADESERWIDGLQPNTTYMADFGVWTQDGQFVPLVRSNAVHTPRDRGPFPDEPMPEAWNMQNDAASRRIPPRYFENFEATR